MSFTVVTRAARRGRYALSFPLLLALGLAACQQPKPAESGAGKRYTLTGTVLSLDQKEHTAKIRGDAVPGWMDAMTMDYPVQSGKVWDSLHPNESIRATLEVHDTDYRIVDVEPAAVKQ